MMDCTEYRQRLLSDPGRTSDGMRRHLAGCHDCTRYTERALQFEGRLERALQVGVEGFPAARVVRPGVTGPGRAGRRSRLRGRGFAIAASVLIATCAAGALWLAAPARSLAAAVVDHMADEPDAWARTDVPVPPPGLDAVMREAGAHLKPGAGLVSYVHSCEFRGHQVPHLVVQTAAGPVTVMVLVHESVRREVSFDQHGFRGVIVPVPDHGSLAVLEQTVDADPKTIDAVAARVMGALDWAS
jgi:hypothetical protein